MTLNHVKVYAPLAPRECCNIMTSEEFCSIGMELFGRYWKKPLAKWLGISAEHVSRMANGHNPVKGPIETAMRAGLMLHQMHVMTDRVRAIANRKPNPLGVTTGEAA